MSENYGIPENSCLTVESVLAYYFVGKLDLMTEE